MEKPFMVKNTIEYSDGTETVILYNENENRELIENRVAQDIAIAEARDTGEILEPVKEKRVRKATAKKVVAKKAKK